MLEFENLKNNFFVIAGPNVIESEEHCINMAIELKKIASKFDITYIFKASFDKANRTSLSSYRGLGIEIGLKILKRIKEELNLPIITDIHESWQAPIVAKVADIIQIPAFLCRQTDLLKAAAETGKIIQIKKGQFCSSDVMHKCKEKIIEFGNSNVILCERGNMLGYNDLVVDPRNLVWLKSNSNLVSMDITHCLQQPAQKMQDGTIKAGGLRELIPYMGKMAVTLGVNGIFMEVHDNPDSSLCDAPTQFPLNQWEVYLNELISLHKFINNKKQKTFNKKVCFIPARFSSSRLPGKPLLEINGKNIIQRVYEQASKAKLLDDVIVLTDDERIKKNVEDIGGKCELVLDDCLNGTERIIKFIEKNEDICDLVINIQGDEPFIDYNTIDRLIESYINNNDPEVKCSMPRFKLDKDELPLKSTGKVVVDKNNNIMYCSRNIIPSSKKSDIDDNYSYISNAGLFIFDKKYLLNEFIKENTTHQLVEDIEWLKVLEQGYKINTILIDFVERSVDTLDDYTYLCKKYSN